MKKIFIRLTKIILSILAVGIIIWAVIAGIVRELFPVLANYKPKIEQLASEIVQQPIQIGEVSGHWRGLSPIFTFNNVVVLNDAKTVAVIKVQQVKISPNLLKSLFYWRFEPAMIQVSGTHLRIQQLADNSLVINGIKGKFAHTQIAPDDDVEDILQWLLTQGKISLTDINVDWYGKNGLHLPIVNLQVELSKGIIHHRLIGIATLAQKIPTKIRFIMNLHGDVLNMQALKANFYLYIADLDLQQWLQQHTIANMRLNSGLLAELQVWGNWSNEQFQQIQSQIYANNLQFAAINKSKHKPVIQIDKVAANLLWQRTYNGWVLSGNQLQLLTNNQLWPTSQFAIQAVNNLNNAQQTVKVDIINLQQLLQFLQNSSLLPTSLQTVVKQLQPKGEITQLTLQHTGTGFDFANMQFSLTAAFNNVVVLPWHDFPGLNNISGRFNLNPTTGHIELEGKQLEITLPKLFKQPYLLEDYAGMIDWQNENGSWHITAKNISADTLNANINGEMALDVPPTGSPVINLLLGFNEEDISRLRDYIPIGILHPKLVTWLEKAFISGDSANGNMVLQGPLNDFPFADHQGKFQLLIHGRNIDFNFKDGWPLITKVMAEVAFNNYAMTIDANSGQILGNPISPVHAEIPDLRKPRLTVQGSMNADLAVGKDFVEQSPLKKLIGTDLIPLQMHGPMHLGLQLDIPLDEDKTDVKVAGNIALSTGATVAIPDWKIVLTELKGIVNFTEDSLNANNITGQFLNHPITIGITTQHQRTAHVTNFNMHGHLSYADLSNQYPLLAFKFIQGETDYNGLLSFINQNDTQKNIFKISSDLTGIAINLPPLLQKSAKQHIPFYLQMNFTDPNKLLILTSYNKIVSAALTYVHEQKKWLFANADIRLGNKLAEFQTLPGILIDGSITALNWSQVQKYVAPYLNHKSQLTTIADVAIKNKLKNLSHDLSPMQNRNDVKKEQQNSVLASMLAELRMIKLAIGKINIFTLTIPQAQLIIQPHDLDWLISINSAMMVGDLLIPHDYPYYPLQADFNHFYLPVNSDDKEQTLNPKQIPPFNFICQDFVYGSRHFGQVALNVIPEGNSLHIKQLRIDSPVQSLTAHGSWSATKSGQETKLRGNLTSTDLGKVLTNWDITQSLVGGKGSADFELNWPGPAYNPDNHILNGKINMQFRDGRIINISQSAETEVGFGRVLNLLSLQTLPRRLTLDFSDLVKKGFSFDTMVGKFVLTQGNAFTDSAILDGPVAKVEIKGRIGLGTRDYDLQMITTPYVTSSLPVIATIAGGPVVGAVTWAANKILGRAVNQITSHTYQITGSWDNPKIN